MINEPQSCYPSTLGSENVSRRHSFSKPAANLGSHLGGAVATKPGNYYTLGLERMGVQPTQDIVHLPVPPSAAAGQSAFGGGSLALNGELLKFIMPSGKPHAAPHEKTHPGKNISENISSVPCSFLKSRIDMHTLDPRYRLPFLVHVSPLPRLFLLCMGERSSRQMWPTPVCVVSGPRKNGEGVEDHHQGIVSTVVVNER